MPSSDFYSEVRSHGRRRTAWVVVCGVLVGACLVTSVVALVAAREARADLRAERVRIGELRGDLAEVALGAASVDAQSDLRGDVADVESRLAEVADMADGIDFFLRTTELAELSDVEGLREALVVLSTYADDLAACVNDNLDAIAEGGQLRYCG